jgi:hypothetical protein
MKCLRFFGAVSGVGFFFCAANAQADTTVMADLDLVLPVASPYHPGAGFGVRVGQQWDIALLALTPELGFTYQSLAEGDPAVYRGVAGLRAGIGSILRPGVFAHVGFGTLGRGVPVRPSFSYDGGVFLDVVLLPLITFGAHLTYQYLSPAKQQDDLHCLLLGLHGGLVF